MKKYYHYTINGMMFADKEKDVMSRILKIFEGASVDGDMSTINIDIKEYPDIWQDDKGMIHSDGQIVRSENVTL